jgi:hypothetical protein
MNGGEISWNDAQVGLYWYDGGGLAIRSAGAVFTMNGGSIHDNTAIGLGGGISVGPDSDNCTLKLTGGEIYNNSVNRYGGGVWIYENLNATFTMSGGKIRNNSAVYWGGGVCINSGNTFNMTGGEITGNFGGWYGGGIYIHNNILDANGKINGDPSIGSKVNGKGSIYGNTGLAEQNDVYYAL